MKKLSKEKLHNNLWAIVLGIKVNVYQRMLAKQELEALETENIKNNQYIDLLIREKKALEKEMERIKQDYSEHRAGAGMVEASLESQLQVLKKSIAAKKEQLWSIVGDPTLRKRLSKLQSIYDNLDELLKP